MNLPLSYICLRLGCMPESVLIVAICISQCCLFARLYMLRGLIGLSAIKYMKRVYFNVVLVAFLSLIVPGIMSRYMEESFVSFIFTSLVAMICTIAVEFYVGCNQRERAFVISKVGKMAQKIKRR